MLRNDPKLEPTTRHFSLDGRLLDEQLKQVSVLRDLEHEYKLATFSVGGSNWAIDYAYDNLDRTFADFKLSARQTLRDQPHYLVALGLDPTP
jgi:hypothetical protein